MKTTMGFSLSSELVNKIVEECKKRKIGRSEFITEILNGTLDKTLNKNFKEIFDILITKTLLALKAPQYMSIESIESYKEKIYDEMEW